MSNSDIECKKRAKELGLPENSTWDDITAHNSALECKKRAKELGLPENSTWDDITAHNAQKRTA